MLQGGPEASRLPEAALPSCPLAVAPRAPDNLLSFFQEMLEDQQRMQARFSTL